MSRRGQVATVVGVLVAIGLVANGSVWLSGHPATALPTRNGDLAEQLWFIAYLPHALGAATNPFTTHLAYAGQGGVNLLSNTSIMAPALLLSPLTVVFGPVLALNVGLIVALVSSGVAMAVLLGRTQCPPWLVVVGSVLWAVNPAVLHLIGGGDLHLTTLWFPPVVATLAVDLVRRQRTPRRLGLALAAAVVVQYFTGTEVLLLTAGACAIAVVSAAVVARPALAAVAGDLVRAIGVALAAAAAVLAYPLWIQLGGPRHTHGAPWPDPSRYDLALSSTLWPTGARIPPSAFDRLLGHVAPSGPPMNYLTVPLVLLAVATAWRGRRDAAVRVLAAVGVVTSSFALGGTVHLGPGASPFLLVSPWGLVEHLPMLDQVLAARWSILAFGAVLLLAGYGATRWWSGEWGRGGRLARRSVGVAVVATVVAVAVVAPFPLGRTADGVAPPSVDRYASSAHGPSRLLVIPLPSEHPGTASPMAWQAEHDFAFALVGGYLLTPTTGSSESAWRVPPRGPDGALANLATAFAGHATTPSAYRDLHRALASTAPTDVVLVPPLVGATVTATTLAGLLGPPVASSDGLWWWHHAHVLVRPAPVSLVDRCGQATSIAAAMACLAVP